MMAVWLTIHRTDATRFEFALDPARGHIPLCIVRYDTKGIEDKRIEVTEIQQCSKGRWFPMRIAAVGSASGDALSVSFSFKHVRYANPPSGSGAGSRKISSSRFSSALVVVSSKSELSAISTISSAVVGCFDWKSWSVPFTIAISP